MNNKDFQNGLIVGVASKQGSNSALTEKFVHEQLAEFKEREVDYTRLYCLPRKQMEEIKPISLPNEKLFTFTPSIQEWAMNNTRGKKINFNISLYVAKGTYNENNNIVDITYALQENNPFNVEDINGILTLTNIDEFIDVAIAVDNNILYLETTIIGFLEDIRENLSEAANITTVFSSGRHTLGTGKLAYISFNYSLSFWIPDEYEGAAETLYEELVSAMTYYNDYFVLKVKNIPEIEEVSSTIGEGF